MSSEQVYTVFTEAAHEGRRMDAVLAELIEEASRSYLQKLIEDGSVFLDGQPQRSKKEKLHGGQRIDVIFPESSTLEILPQKMDLEIVYEDEDLLLVNKPKGLVVHPAAGNPDGTLVNGLLYHCKDLSAINGVQRPGIVHRIDKDTTGLLVVAKSNIAHRELSRQLAEHTMKRQYSAIVWFGFSQDQGRIDAPLGRDPKNRLKRTVTTDGKPAVTHYRVVERLSSFTLIEAILETGRTHQIRVHMAHVKHPLLGDVLYGPRKQPYGLSGQVLHAGVLGFVHPTKKIEMCFQADLPKEFQDILEKLRK